MRLLGLVVILALSSALVPFASQDAAGVQTVALHQSEEFGYLFFYDASLWEVVEQETGPGFDIIELTDGDVVVDSRAFTAPGMTARDCIDWVINDLLPGDPSVVTVEFLGAPPETPQDGDRLSETFAATELIVTVDEAGDRFKVATREECHELAPGRSVLYTSIEIPAASWNAGRQFHQSLVPAGSAGSVIPWFKRYIPGDETGAGRPQRELSVPVVGATGEAVGTLSAEPFDPCGLPEFVVARNVGEESNFVIDPSSFVAASSFADELVTVNAEWLYPDVPSTSPLVLQPGEVGLIRLSLQMRPTLFYYLPETGPRVVFNESIPGGCGGGASPVVIDME